MKSLSKKLISAVILTSVVFTQSSMVSAATITTNFEQKVEISTQEVTSLATPSWWTWA
jgi:hypothetical protein